MRKRLRSPDERALNDAFLFIVGSLPKRPEPRGPWDARARSDRRVPHPAFDAVTLCQSALHAAIETNDAQTIRAVRLAIEAYFLKAMLAATSVGVVLDTTPLVTDIVQADCEAIPAIVRASVTGSEGAISEAFQKVQSLIDISNGYLRTVDAQRPRMSA